MSTFHAGLGLGRFIPQISFGERIARLQQRAEIKPRPVPPGIHVEDLTVPGPEGAPEVALRIFRPAGLVGPAPALFWIHGGGFIGGAPTQDDRTNIAFARELGITVVAVKYRLAPDHPSPAAVVDAYAGLRWLFEHAEERGVDPARIAVGGASAGGGLAAGLVLSAYDRGEVTPCFQLLVYPMLDDRTVLRTDLDTRNVRVWTPGSNRYAWSAYLGQAPGSPGVSPYAAPARRDDLHGLPPTWIGVGSLDLFHDEDLLYAARLREAGVACETFVVRGAFHGFDALFTRADVSKQFWRRQALALRQGFAAVIAS